MSPPGSKNHKLSDVSIVTVCLNAKTSLPRCVASISEQKIRPLEYIIVDGGSDDGSVELLKNLKKIGQITEFISERDAGISDAFNKGIKLCRSKYICFLNADDWLENDHIMTAQQGLEQGCDIIISDIVFRRKTDRRLIPRYPKFGGKVNWTTPQINHPGMIIKRDLFDKIGGYSLCYSVAMDVEFFYRAIRAGAKIHSTQKSTVTQTGFGVSQKKWLLALYELYRIERNFGRSHFCSLTALLSRFLRTILRRLSEIMIK